MGLLIGLNGVQSGTSLTGQRLAAATTDAWSTGVTGDTGDRFVIDADGKHWWDAGDGGTADTNLYRSAAGVLKTDGDFVVGGTNLIGAGTFVVKPAGGGVLYLADGAGVARIYINSNDSVIHFAKALQMQNGTYAGGSDVGACLSSGTGAPNNANGANGDIYLRVDGGALTTIYQRRAGAWVGIV